MGQFQLEEAFQNVLTMLGDDCDFNLDQIQDFNLNMEQVIRDQNVERGQNNITETGQGMMNMQPKTGMMGMQQPGMGQPQQYNMGQQYMMGGMGVNMMGQQNPMMGQMGMAMGQQYQQQQQQFNQY